MGERSSQPLEADLRAATAQVADNETTTKNTMHQRNRLYDCSVGFVRATNWAIPWKKTDGAQAAIGYEEKDGKPEKPPENLDKKLTAIKPGFGRLHSPRAVVKEPISTYRSELVL